MPTRQETQAIKDSLARSKLILPQAAFIAVLADAALDPDRQGFFAQFSNGTLQLHNAIAHFCRFPKDDEQKFLAEVERYITTVDSNCELKPILEKGLSDARNLQTKNADRSNNQQITVLVLVALTGVLLAKECPELLAVLFVIAAALALQASYNKSHQGDQNRNHAPQQ